MRNSYAQVFITYFRQPLAFIILLTSVISMALPVMMIRKFTVRGDFIGLQFMLGVFSWSIFVWGHFRKQVVNTRLRLCPDFVAPQLMSFLFLFGATLALLAFILQQFGNASALGSTSLMAAFFAVTGLIILTQSLLLCMLGVGAALAWIYLGSGLAITSSIYHGEMDDIASLVAIVSFLIVGFILICFFNLTEENTFYHRGVRSSDDLNLKPRMSGEGNQLWAKMPETGLIAYLSGVDRRSNIDGNSRWGSFHRWRYERGWKLVMMGAFVAVVTMIIPNLVVSHATGSQPSAMPDQTLIALVGTVSFIWLQRWKYIEAELLRPIDRPAFFKQLGLAMIFDYALALAITLCAMLLPVLIWGRSLQGVPMMLSVLLRVVVVIFSFGLTAWALRSKSKLMHVLIMGIVTPFVLLPVLPNGPLQNPRDVPWILASMAAATLIGVALAWQSYRRWLTIELG